jgi:hypothetical protein
LYTTQSYLREKQAKGSKYVKKKRSDYSYSAAESVPLDDLDNRDDDIEDPETPLSKNPTSVTSTTPYFNLIHPSLLTKKVLGPIFLYCVIAFCSMLYMTAIPIYLSASQDDFGLGLSARETSICTMLISMVKFPLQVYGFQHYVKHFKSLTSCYQSGMMLLIPVHLILPLIQSYADSIYTKWTLLTLCMGLIGVAEVLAFLSVIVLITESVTDQLGTGMLGLVHGLASTCSATVRALSPPIAGSLWGQGSAPLVFGFNGFLILVLGIFGSNQF